MSLRLLLAALLLCSAAGLEDVEPILVLPRVLRAAVAPWQLAAFSLPAGASISASLRSATGEEVAKGVGTADEAGHAPFLLSPALPLQGGLHTLAAWSGGWNSSVNVTLVPSAPFLSVLLDKRTYKPGDVVRVRALALSSSLRPLAVPLNLSAVDPSGFVVARSAAGSSTDAYGVLNWKLATSTEPPLGAWRVVAQGGPEFGPAAEAPFQLARYVLPTFSVSISAPPFLVRPTRAHSVALTGTLSALHTSGEPLTAASVTLTVLQAALGWGRRRLAMKMAAGAAMMPHHAQVGFSGGGGGGGGGGRDPTVLATQTLRLGGALSLAFSISLPVPRVLWDDGGEVPPLLVTASVSEEATGESRNGSAAVAAAAHPLRVELHAPTRAVAGLDWWLRVRVSAPDGSAPPRELASGAQLAVTATARSGLQLLNLALPVSLDAEGRALVNVSLPPDGESECCRRGGGGGNSSDAAAVEEDLSCCLSNVAAQLGFVRRRAALSSLVSHAWASCDADPGPSLQLGPLELRAGVLRFAPACTADGAPVGWAALSASRGLLASGVAAAGASVEAALGGVTDARLLAWTRVGDALVLDSAAVEAEEGAAVAGGADLPANLSASFSAETAKPGEAVQLRARAAPSARVFFFASDASVALMDGDASLNASQALAGAAAADAAALTRAGGGAGGQECYNPPAWLEAGAVLATRLAAPACKDGGMEAGVAFMARPANGEAMMKMNVARSAVMPIAMAAMVMNDQADAAPAGGAEPPRTRSLFPETWVWFSADADADGAAVLSATAPDTLTGWRLTAFSLHPEAGLAVAPVPPPLHVTLPFYIRLTLPASAVRGEALQLRVALFSSLPDGGTATVRLVGAEEAGFELPPGAQTTREVKLPAAAGGVPAAAGVTFDVTPRALGSLTLRLVAQLGAASDSLEQPLFVLPEGLPGEVTANALLNASGGVASSTLRATAPPSAVEGSVRSLLTVTGDLMGPSVGGLGNLLAVPCGCGEQNMIGMAPNVAVLQYAASSAAAGAAPQPPALLESARANAALGWQRELTYRHVDGSFSAFGQSDSSGSTWLTAFVLRVFASAQPFLSLDDSVLDSAAAWLVAQQRSDGAFASVGNVVHAEMVGGASSDVSLSAYVLSALLEARAHAPPAALEAGAAFLLAQAGAESDAYARHVRAHALAAACAAPALRERAGVCEASDASLAELLAQLSDGPLPHWAAGEGPPPAGQWQAPSADIELTGYGVLALLARGRLADAAGPARWLVGQRGGAGGFASTQDTVVGLAALAAFAAAAAAQPPKLTLVVRPVGGGAPLASLELDESNANTMQQVELPAGAEVAAEARGRGVALLQLTTRYSSLPAGGAAAGAPLPAFLLSSQALRLAPPARRRSLLQPAAAAAAAAQPQLMHHRTCFLRAAAGRAAEEAGMVLLQVGLFSGYVPLASSLEAARASAPQLLKRVDVTPRGVTFYLERLAAADGGQCVGFDAVQATVVGNLSAASTTIHDYYAPQRAGAVSLAAAAVRAADSRPASALLPAAKGEFAAAAAEAAEGARARAAATPGGKGGRSRQARKRAVKAAILAAASVALVTLIRPSLLADVWGAARTAARTTARRKD